MLLLTGYFLDIMNIKLVPAFGGNVMPLDRVALVF